MKVAVLSFSLALVAAFTEALTVTPPPAATVPRSSSDLESLSLVGYSSSLSSASEKEILQLAGSNLAESSILLSAASVNEAAAVQLLNIVDIHYDGAVPTTEADEYVVIKNFAKQPLDVSGYIVYVFTSGTQGPTFKFPEGSVIKPGSTVRIYTNEVHKETGGYSFGSGKAIWNNRGGLAVFRDNQGKKIGEYKYKA